MTLPESILRKAAFSDGECSWRLDEFPNVLHEAALLGLACAGGQFQFRCADGPTCEMYWLEADTRGQRAGESWPDYVIRSEREVAETFQRLCAETDWRHEAMQWKDTIYCERVAAGIDARSLLAFVAYFEHETQAA
jgi:hypothetical protein